MKKKGEFLNMPPYMIIKLKNFEKEDVDNEAMNTMLIDFPLTGINLTEFTLGPNREEAVYSVSSIMENEGNSKMRKYSASVLNHLNYQWYYFQDENVKYIANPNESLVTPSIFMIILFQENMRFFYRQSIMFPYLWPMVDRPKEKISPKKPNNSDKQDLKHQAIVGHDKRLDAWLFEGKTGSNQALHPSQSKSLRERKIPPSEQTKTLDSPMIHPERIDPTNSDITPKLRENQANTPFNETNSPDSKGSSPSLVSWSLLPSRQGRSRMGRRSSSRNRKATMDWTDEASPYMSNNPNNDQTLDPHRSNYPNTITHRMDLTEDKKLIRTLTSNRRGSVASQKTIENMLMTPPPLLNMDKAIDEGDNTKPPLLLFDTSRSKDIKLPSIYHKEIPKSSRQISRQQYRGDNHQYHQYHQEYLQHQHYQPQQQSRRKESYDTLKDKGQLETGSIKHGYVAYMDTKQRNGGDNESLPNESVYGWEDHEKIRRLNEENKNGENKMGENIGHSKLIFTKANNILSIRQISSPERGMAMRNQGSNQGSNYSSPEQRKKILNVAIKMNEFIEKNRNLYPEFQIHPTSEEKNQLNMTNKSKSDTKKPEGHKPSEDYKQVISKIQIMSENGSQ